MGTAQAGSAGPMPRARKLDSRLMLVALPLLALAGCAADPAVVARPPGAPNAPALRAENLYVVDCLLPAQIRQLGRLSPYLAPRRAVKTSARDCEIRGGEYVSYDRSDHATALRVWLPLAREGNPTAQVYAGEIYEKGLGVASDYTTAAQWYRRAADQGDARAQINLGHLYEKGLGVERDPGKALEWYRRASGLKEAIVLDTADLDLARREREELEALRTELERRQREAEALRAQLEQAQRDLAQARQELERRRAEADAEWQRVEEARRELEASRQRAAGRSDAALTRLQAQLGEREADLERQHQAAAALQRRVAELEAEAAGQRTRLARLQAQQVEVAGPTVEMIEPSLVGTRGVAVVRVAAEAAPSGRVIMGRVTAPAGLLLLTVNDREETVDGNGLFRTRIALAASGSPVRVVAVDRQGKRGQVEFRLAPEELPGAAARPTARTPPRLQLGTYHALIIGNRAYAHWPSLRTPEADARKTAEVLSQKYGFKTRLLLDARRVDILQALNELRDRLTEKDNLLIYYAGHGYLDEKINRAYWVPVDGHLDSNVEWIPTVAITDLVAAMSARHVLLVVDSCYAGALTRSALARLEAGMSEEARRHWLEVVAAKRSRTVLSSGDVKPVLDAGGGQHSVFARAWLDVLARNEEILEGQGLYREIAARVSYAADALRFEQVPQYAPLRYAGHESGDFLFAPSGM